jgi:hypothetical protein
MDSMAGVYAPYEVIFHDEVSVPTRCYNGSQFSAGCDKSLVFEKECILQNTLAGEERREKCCSCTGCLHNPSVSANQIAFT